MKPKQPESNVIWKKTYYVWDVEWTQLMYEFENWEAPWKKFGWKEMKVSNSFKFCPNLSI